MADRATEREAEEARRKEGSGEMTVHEAGMIAKDLIETGQETGQEER